MFHCKFPGLEEESWLAAVKPRSVSPTSSTMKADKNHREDAVKIKKIKNKFKKRSFTVTLIHVSRMTELFLLQPLMLQKRSDADVAPSPSPRHRLLSRRSAALLLRGLARLIDWTNTWALAACFYIPQVLEVISQSRERTGSNGQRWLVEPRSKPLVNSRHTHARTCYGQY